MRLKTQENIRKLELIALLGSAIVVTGKNTEIINELYDLIGNNIDINDIDKIYDTIKNIYYLDILYSFSTQKITSDYKELEKLYDKVITNTGDLISEFDFKDPISVFAFYIHMYRSGYLSYNKDFKYSTNMKDFSCLNGLDVIRGRGVCRSVASMLSDIYRNINMESQCMIVKTDGDTIRQLEHLSEINVEETENSEKFVKFVSTLTKYIPIPNHMITAVTANGKNYILDPMNDGIMYNDNRNKLVLLNNPDYSMKNFPTLMSFYKLLGMFEGNLKINKSLKSIDEEEYRKTYLDALKVCKDNIWMLENFYEENKELYHEIYHKSKDQSGMIKRICPIIPFKKI